MAEGLLNVAPPPGWQARSAGTEPKTTVRDNAVTVMREVGIDISRQRPKGMEEALGPDVALIIGLCEEEACPHVPGVQSLHWPVPNPRGDLRHYREIRDELRARINQLIADLQGSTLLATEGEA